MSVDRLLVIGIIGTAIAGICCFTPALIVVFGALGLSAWVMGLDMILLPTLALFIAITVFALWKRQNSQSSWLRTSLVHTAPRTD